MLLYYIRKSIENNKNILLYIIAFSIVVAIGSLFRESNLTLALALLFIFNPLKSLDFQLKNFTSSHIIKLLKQIQDLYFIKQSIIFFIPIIFIVVTNLFISKFTKVTLSDYNYIKLALFWFYNKSLPEYILGLCIAFGPLILLLPFYHNQFKLFLLGRQELLILLIIGLCLGYIGGSDTERISFMSCFPILFIFIGISIQNIFYSSQRWWFFVMFILQTISYRFYWFLPDYPGEIKHMPIPFITIVRNHFEFLYLYSHHGHYILNSIFFIEYLFLFLITIYVMHNKIVFPLLKK